MLPPFTFMPTKSHRIERAPDSPWISVKTAADYLGVSIDTIYDACHRRGLKHTKLGHSTIRLKVEWIDEWLESQARQTPLRPARKTG